MTHPKIIIILFFVFLCSCGNNSTESPQANNHKIDKLIDTVSHVTKQQIIDPVLLSSWTHFKDVVSSKNYKEFKNISLDTLQICHKTLAAQNFLEKCYFDVFDKPLLQEFADTLYSDYVDNEMELGYFSQSVLKQTDIKNNVITLRQFQIIKEFTSDGAWTMTFDFVKTKNGYKFFGCDSFGGPICCR